jgi:hypothetical protein
MHRVVYLLAIAILLLPVVASAQNLSVDCGSPQLAADAIEVFTERFTSSDSVFVDYRERNGLQALSDGGVREAVTDPAVCRQLASLANDVLTGDAYWRTAQWETAYARFGPYYLVYVEQRLPPGMVGGGWLILLFDAAFERIPTAHECNC